MPPQQGRGQQQRQWSGPDFSITSFETPDNSVKVNEDFTLVAVVAYRRSGPPHQTQHVVFEDNGTEIGEAPTDGEGRAELDHSFTTSGPHRLTAQIRGIPVSRVRHQVNVKVPEKPEDPAIARLKKHIEITSKWKELLDKIKELEATRKPVSPAVPTSFNFFARPDGPSREYYVTAETGIEGVVVEILDPGNPQGDQRRIVRESGKDGAVRLCINTRKPRELFGSVPSAPNIPKLELKLAGPEPDLAPVKIPRVPENVLNGSWADLFAWSASEATKLNKKQGS